MKSLVKLLVLVVFISGGSLYASWPKTCGNEGQQTCLASLHPLHSGCKSGLKECDIAGSKRNICIKKEDKCPVTQNCTNCGNEGQKPCTFNPECHMCKKGYHVKLSTGKCTKTENPNDTLLHVLKDIDKHLKKYEKNCNRFAEHLEKALSKDLKKDIKKMINSNKKEKHILNDTNYVAGYESACLQGNFNGFACGILPWLRSYNELLIKFVDTKHEKNAKKHYKAFRKFTDKFLKHFLYSKKAKKIFDPVARFAYAMVLTLNDYGKNIKNCSKHVFDDIKKELKNKKFKKPTDKQIKAFVKQSCYNIGSSEFTFMADQALAAITAGAGEAVELPKDVKTFINVIKKVANAKIKLENAIDESGEYFNMTHVKGFMKHHKTCKPLLEFVK